MSALTRYSQAQVAAWASRTVEPIEIGQLGEWTRQEWKGARDHLPPNERYIELRKGDAEVTLLRCWDRPLHPGHPMQVASTRPFVIDGRAVELVRTSMFEGSARELEACFIPGKDWFVRITFERCSPQDIDAVCAAIRFEPSVA